MRNLSELNFKKVSYSLTLMRFYFSSQYLCYVICVIRESTLDLFQDEKLMAFDEADEKLKAKQVCWQNIFVVLPFLLRRGCILPCVIHTGDMVALLA